MQPQTQLPGPRVNQARRPSGNSSPHSRAPNQITLATSLILHLFIFNKHLKAYFVPGPILSAKEIGMKKLGAQPPGSPPSSWGGRNADRHPIQILHQTLPNPQSLCSISCPWDSFCFDSRSRNPALFPDWSLAILLLGQKPCPQISSPCHQPICKPLFIEWGKANFFTGWLILCFRTLTWLSSLVSYMNYPVSFNFKVHVILCISYLKRISRGSIPHIF